MANDSATGGPLQPEPFPVPIEDQDLDRFLQQYVAGITGLDGKLIRQRWQVEPPNLPDAGVNWVAIGVMNFDADKFSVVMHHSEGEGFDELQRHEVFDLLCSFYGPNADKYSSLLRDGLSIIQNREPLFLAGMALVEVGQIVSVPAIIKQTWQYRVDVPVRFRRAIQRYYPVLNLLSAEGTISGESVGVTFNVTP